MEKKLPIQVHVILFFLLAYCNSVFAQNINVAGKVTDANGQGLQAISVQVVGSTTGTSTDADGNFTISASATDSLLFSSIGYVSQTVAINNRTTITIQMSEDTKVLSDVVVTALGIERSSKSLSYSTTNISADELTEVKCLALFNSLAGKAAGVVDSQGAGGPGSNPRIVLRGNKSIVGDNQPLYVVVGVPIGGFADYNSEDIASLQVLQGASAAALYGSQAANGVILITTKKGQFGTTSVDFSSSTMFDNPLVLPELQTSYGQGLGGESVEGINDSWGPKISNG